MGEGEKRRHFEKQGVDTFPVRGEKREREVERGEIGEGTPLFIFNPLRGEGER